MPLSISLSQTQNGNSLSSIITNIPLKYWHTTACIDNDIFSMFN
jgi:hypothetical protein